VGHAWLYSRQLIVNMRVSGLYTPTCNGPGSSGARPVRIRKHDVTEALLLLASA
jgi:hypothetical protein